MYSVYETSFNEPIYFKSNETIVDVISNVENYIHLFHDDIFTYEMEYPSCVNYTYSHGENYMIVHNNLYALGLSIIITGIKMKEQYILKNHILNLNHDCYL
jgi:hypothetical protein